MKKLAIYSTAVVLVIVGIIGCVRRAHSRTAEKSTPIWCTPAAAAGDSKDKIRNAWGEPDVVNDMGFDEAGLKKEEWVYYSKPFSFLSQNAYVCVTQRLLFAGDNLTKISSSIEKLAGK